MPENPLFTNLILLDCCFLLLKCHFLIVSEFQFLTKAAPPKLQENIPKKNFISLKAQIAVCPVD